jgi:hypothetical protein
MRPTIAKKLTELEEGDFYKINNLIIFTEQYHRKRGYCCKNGCKHCPYGNSRV